MSSPEEQKVCVHCGADLAHQDRYKNHEGQYVCPACVKQRHRWSSRFRRLRRRLKKSRKWAAWAVAAICGAAIFLSILRYFANAMSGPLD